MRQAMNKNAVCAIGQQIYHPHLGFNIDHCHTASNAKLSSKLAFAPHRPGFLRHEVASIVVCKLYEYTAATLRIAIPKDAFQSSPLHNMKRFV